MNKITITPKQYKRRLSAIENKQLKLYKKSPCYLSFERMQKEFEALKEYYAKNKIAIYKIIIEYEF